MPIISWKSIFHADIDTKWALLSVSCSPVRIGSQPLQGLQLWLDGSPDGHLVLRLGGLSIGYFQAFVLLVFPRIRDRGVLISP